MTRGPCHHRRGPPVPVRTRWQRPKARSRAPPPNAARAASWATRARRSRRPRWCARGTTARTTRRPTLTGTATPCSRGRSSASAASRRVARRRAAPPATRRCRVPCTGCSWRAVPRRSEWHVLLLRQRGRVRPLFGGRDRGARKRAAPRRRLCRPVRRVLPQWVDDGQRRDDPERHDASLPGGLQRRDRLAELAQPDAGLAPSHHRLRKGRALRPRPLPPADQDPDRRDRPQGFDALCKCTLLKGCHFADTQTGHPGLDYGSGFPSVLGHYTGLNAKSRGRVQQRRGAHGHELHDGRHREQLPHHVRQLPVHRCGRPPRASHIPRFGLRRLTTSGEWREEPGAPASARRLAGVAARLER